MSAMPPTSHFSFEIQYSEHSASSPSERAQVMESLGPTLQQLLAAQDGEATVQVSESHTGDDHKLVELTSTLADAQVQQMLQAFAARHGVRVQALE